MASNFICNVFQSLYLIHFMLLKSKKEYAELLKSQKLSRILQISSTTDIYYFFKWSISGD
jgi:hypothetical protein